MKKRLFGMAMSSLLLMLLLAGCTGIPQGVTVVDRFELNRYLGTWHEVARIDNSFEKGYEQVNATYSMRDDGKVRVVNKGYDPLKKRWKCVEGKGKFAGDPAVGALQVSFFGPFYASYNIVALDRQNYSWAMVTGNKRSYFWILSRKPEMEKGLQERLVGEAGTLGFDTSRLRYLTPPKGE